MMLMKFSDLSQSDHSNWVMWQVKDIGIDTNIEVIVIRTQHDCPSQMNENLLISNSKLTSDSEIWWR